FAQTFEPVNFWFADFVGFVSQLALAIVAFDGKHFVKNRFKAGAFVTFSAGVGLQKLPVGIGLQFNHVRRHHDLFDLAEVDSFYNSRWHWDFPVWPATAPGRYFLFNDTRQAHRVQRPACQTKLLLAAVRNFQIFHPQNCGNGAAPASRAPPNIIQLYLTSTFAPASSSFFLAASESALLAPSSTGLGAPSTSALASARPSPAFTSRTALMTAIFLSAGRDTRTTSNVSLAAAAGAAAP